MRVCVYHVAVKMSIRRTTQDERATSFFFFHFPATDATIEVDGARYITSRLTVVFVVLVCVCVAYRSSSSYIFFGRVDKISHEYGNYITYRLTKRVDGRNNITMKKEDYTLVTT